MEITAESPHPSKTSRPPEQRSLLLRIAVPSVAAAGAFALVWAGLLSGGPAAFASILGAFVALAGSLTWEFRPAVGRWLLGVTGAAGLVWSGAVMLSGGSVPWLLVGFWGSAAVLLAAVLDIVVGPGLDRSATIAVVAVTTLLLLSALGLGEYVRATWSPAERSILEQLPLYRAAMTASVDGAVKRAIAPVHRGEWGSTWHNLTTDPTTELERMRQAMKAEGWNVTEPAPMQLLASKNGFVVEVYERALKETTTATTASVGIYDVQVAVHVGTVGTHVPAQ